MKAGDFPQNLSSSDWVKLAERALGNWDVGLVQSVEFIGVRENCVFKVETEAGVYALRFHRPGYQSVLSITSELTWTEALIKSGIGCPSAVSTNEGALCGLMEVKGAAPAIVVSLVGWSPGIALHKLEDREGSFFRLGSVASALHQHSREWQKPDGFERPHWNAGGLVGQNAIWGRFEEDACLGEEETGLLRKVVNVITRRLEDVGDGADVYGLIHADMLTDNILLDGEDIHVIDFDDCGYGYWLYDLASSLANYVGVDFYGVLRDKWFEGYRSGNGETAYFPDILDTLVMARLIKILGWMNSRPHTKTAKEMGAVFRKGLLKTAYQYSLNDGRLG